MPRLFLIIKKKIDLFFISIESTKHRQQGKVGLCILNCTILNQTKHIPGVVMYKRVSLKSIFAPISCRNKIYIKIKIILLQKR